MSVAGRHRTDREAICKRQAAITADAAAGPEQKAGCQQEEVAWQKQKGSEMDVEKEAEGDTGDKT